MSNVNSKARSLLEAVCKGFNKLASAQAELNEKRLGNYSGTVAAAIESGDADTFAATYESLKADIAGNVGNIGRKLGCKLGKADKEGNAKYTVPSGLMSAASVVLGAMRYGISLSDSDGKPRTFSEIREAKSKADAAANESKLTPIQRAQAEVKALAARIAAGADALTMSEAAEVAKILTAVLATESGAKPAAKAA